MVKIYSWKFHVRSYEMNAQRRVSPWTLLHYLEEGAMQASAANGYDYSWYITNQRIWVVRKITVRYFRPATYGDVLDLRTWVSDYRRVQSHREYDLRCGDEQVLRARTNWVFLHAQTRQLERIDPEIMAQFDPTNVLEPLDTGIAEPIVVESPIVHSEERRVQQYELDSAGHVDHAVYLAWASQSLANALRAINWPPERLMNSGFTMQPLADEAEYYRSALDNEPIRVVTKLAQVGRDRAEWQHQIRHGATDELIANILSVYSFNDAHGPRSIPDALYLSLVVRPKS